MPETQRNHGVEYFVSGSRKAQIFIHLKPPLLSPSPLIFIDYPVRSDTIHRLYPSSDSYKNMYNGRFWLGDILQLLCFQLAIKLSTLAEFL